MPDGPDERSSAIAATSPDGTASRDAILAIDLGGSTTRIGRFSGAPDAASYVPLARFPTAPRYADQIERLAQVIGMAGTLAGVGLSVGAQIARDGSSVATSPNLPDYVGRPLVGDLIARTGIRRIRLAHDGICGLLAEWQLGALRARERCAYVTLSTGTGAAIRVGSAEGGQLISIQLGHQILSGNPLHCLCGQTGCLETITGGRQLERRLGALPSDDDAAFWDTYVSSLATGLVNLAQLTRVEVVAISGGIALGRPWLVPRIAEAAGARIHDANLTILPAQLGEDAPLIGAALLLRAAAHDIVH